MKLRRIGALTSLHIYQDSSAEPQIFQVYHGRVNSSPFLASLILFQFILPLLCLSTLSRGHFEVKAIFDNAKMTPPCVAGAFVSRENKQ